jgi:hypothetical protein
VLSRPVSVFMSGFVRRPFPLSGEANAPRRPLNERYSTQPTQRPGKGWGAWNQAPRRTYFVDSDPRRLSACPATPGRAMGE